jgi:pimeloyl-ACP methyl ester carboxylesterase
VKGFTASFELMAGDTIAFIQSVIGRPVHLLGSSDGAILALEVARLRPDLVRRLVFVAGVFHRDGWEDGVLDGEPPEFLRQSYRETSPDGIGRTPPRCTGACPTLSSPSSREPRTGSWWRSRPCAT